MPEPPSLAERLGHGADARVLIITCDDLGATRAANVAVYDALRRGLATSASLMVPAPWGRDAAAMWRGEDVGVHLTLNSELDTYRWGPITHAPSLLDGDGGFPRTLEDTWDHADVDEVRRECRAQVERAILWGFDVSHVDSHMHALEMRPEFFDVYLDLALDFGLPIRLRGPEVEHAAGFPFRKLAAEEGVLFPDHHVEAGRDVRRTIERALFDLRPGVTEISIRPALDTDELRSAYGDWSRRVQDHAYLCDDPSLRDLVERSGAVLTDYREIRELQRR